MANNKRQVTVEFNVEHRVFFVRYVERQKHQRYFAAQFSSNDGKNTVETVKAWVRQQSNLELVENN